MKFTVQRSDHKFQPWEVLSPSGKVVFRHSLRQRAEDIARQATRLSPKEIPPIGATVEVSDPLGYSGRGVVKDVQIQPHHAVFVEMQTITDRTDQTVVGRVIWVLAGHVTQV